MSGSRSTGGARRALGLVMMVSSPNTPAPAACSRWHLSMSLSKDIFGNLASPPPIRYHHHLHHRHHHHHQILRERTFSNFSSSSGGRNFAILVTTTSESSLSSTNHHHHRSLTSSTSQLSSYRCRMGRVAMCGERTCSSSSSSVNPSSAQTSSGEAKIESGPLHDQEGVDVVYFRGLPQFTVPLPSRRERCRFIVKPLTNTVGDLLDMIQHEDRGVDRIGFMSADGVKIASANTIEMLMEHNFKMLINDNVYHVATPPQEKPSEEELTKLSSIRNLVGQLYGALNVDEHQLRTEREMVIELEKLKGELVPMEGKTEAINELAMKKTNNLTWVGLGLMSVQFGILARLTWWEYSWDIMEPVTYFVTYGTAMLAYAYFVLTKQEYILPAVTDRQYLILFHKNAKKVGLDVDKYNHLKDRIHKIETDLNRLRDPLALHLPLRTRLGGEGGGGEIDIIRDPPTSQSLVSKATQNIRRLFRKSPSPSSSSGS